MQLTFISLIRYLVTGSWFAARQGFSVYFSAKLPSVIGSLFATPPSGVISIRVAFDSGLQCGIEAASDQRVHFDEKYV